MNDKSYFRYFSVVLVIEKGLPSFRWAFFYCILCKCATLSGRTGPMPWGNGASANFMLHSHEVLIAQLSAAVTGSQ